MESNVVWSERFTLNLPPEISRDKSELDYLRRTNKEAWEAAPKPRLMPATAQKMRPIVIVQPVFVAWAAEFLELPITAVETPSDIEYDAAEDDAEYDAEYDAKCDRDVHTPEDFRRDSGVGMEEDEEENIMIMEMERPKNPAGDCCTCRRDSGISMDDDFEPLHRHQSFDQACRCDDDENQPEEDLFYCEDEFNREIPLDEAMIGLAV